MPQPKSIARAWLAQVPIAAVATRIDSKEEHRGVFLVIVLSREAGTGRVKQEHQSCRFAGTAQDRNALREKPTRNRGRLLGLSSPQKNMA